MDVKINDESGIKSAYYVYFLHENSYEDPNLRYRRYKLATNNYDKYFPNLVDRNWYLPDTLDLLKTDSYIGMSIRDTLLKLVSVIIPPINFPDNYNYPYIYITDNAATEPSLIEDNWLYFIDYSDVTNVNISYIVEFIESDTSTQNSDEVNKVIVRYHELDPVAHKEDTLYFPSDKHSDSLMSNELANFITSAYYHAKNTARISNHSGNMRTLGANLNLTTAEYKDGITNFSSDKEQNDNTIWFNDLKSHYDHIRKEDFDYGYRYN